MVGIYHVIAAFYLSLYPTGGGIGFVKYRKYPRRRFFQPAISRTRSTQDIGYTYKKRRSTLIKMNYKTRAVGRLSQVVTEFFAGGLEFYFNSPTHFYYTFDARKLPLVYFGSKYNVSVITM